MFGITLVGTNTLAQTIKNMLYAKANIHMVPALHEENFTMMC